MASESEWRRGEEKANKGGSQGAIMVNIPFVIRHNLVLLSEKRLHREQQINGLAAMMGRASWACSLTWAFCPVAV